ncbi:hypothetical protein PC129_g18736 [Phytophthora cactorum]|uniref:Uncharacterized protein n=1 Tax=Phytophthora cactorum TaxID=29920 RepID=A0A329S3L7_9STRA|nr:hypothetical protein Pcac1_g7634 [Phytophthora cactorum]KAG2801964.1 hypothetical protein PC112_g19831 [Phytophthora cactorum]KAG2817582.1 hypothetical protein PC111_g12652 [Phytophthora cactorum]KAG2849675.1 hypothetical protein PC113_g17353 [Phytophthora cactorum]KAG2886272.1 hypothetical protein PC114_g19338 [Phytophthora cactorum]
MQGDRDTNGRPALRVAEAKLAYAGLSENDVTVRVKEKEVAAGHGPVHLPVKIPEYCLPLKRDASDDFAVPAKRQKDICTEWKWKEEGGPIYSLEGDEMFFVNRDRATQQLLEIYKSNHNHAQTVVPIMDNVCGLV